MNNNGNVEFRCWLNVFWDVAGVLLRLDMNEF